MAALRSKLQYALSPYLKGTDPRTVTVIVSYLVVSSTSTVISTLIGSMSEYRFPHPLRTTMLHLIISISLLSSVSCLRRLIRVITSPSSRLSRQLSSTPATKEFTEGWLLSTLAKFLGRAPASIVATTESTTSSVLFLTPLSLTAALASVVASLMEMRAMKITEAPFWTTARLLPLAFVLLVSLLAPTLFLPTSLRRTEGMQKGFGIVLFAILIGGPGKSLNASSEGWFSGMTYAASVTAWIIAVKAGVDEALLEKRSSPSILQHLTLSSLLLLAPLILSKETGAAMASGHFGFFTEVGFWVQELIMAACGLASLASFWMLIKYLDPIAVFTVVALKDTLMPHIYHTLFSNPFPTTNVSSALTSGQHTLALLILGAIFLADGTPEKRVETNVKAS